MSPWTSTFLVLFGTIAVNLQGCDDENTTTTKKKCEAGDENCTEADIDMLATLLGAIDCKDKKLGEADSKCKDNCAANNICEGSDGRGVCKADRSMCIKTSLLEAIDCKDKKLGEADSKCKGNCAANNMCEGSDGRGVCKADESMCIEVSDIDLLATLSEATDTDLLAIDCKDKKLGEADSKCTSNCTANAMCEGSDGKGACKADESMCMMVDCTDKKLGETESKCKGNCPANAMCEGSDGKGVCKADGLCA